jgi:hypothetical protein
LNKTSSVRSFHRAYALLLAASVMCCVFTGAVWATDDAAITLTLRDHKFSPNPLEVPAGVRQLILIDNQDSTSEEFESESMHREKVLHAKAVTRLFVGPLKPGRYDYFGDFHEGQAKGVVVAK